MSGDFWVGLLALPVVGAALLGLWVFFAYASTTWHKLHRKMVLTVPLRPNPVSVRFRGDTSPQPSPRPKYEDSANKMRDALLTSPKMYTLKGFGWVLIGIRDTKNAPEMDA